MFKNAISTGYITENNSKLYYICYLKDGLYHIAYRKGTLNTIKDPIKANPYNIPKADIHYFPSRFDTNKLDYLFYKYPYQSIVIIDDVENIISMKSMFEGSQIKYVNTQNWNIKSLENTQDMFKNTNNISVNVENWDLQSLKNTKNMFKNSNINN